MLAKGSRAPDFCLRDEQGNQIYLSTLHHQHLCLVFFPDMKALADQIFVINFMREYEQFQRLGVSLLGICGADPAKANLSESHTFLPFPLWYDKDREIRKAYAVWNRKMVFGKERWVTNRCAMLIDEKGIISHTFKRLSIDTGVSEILNYVQYQYDKEQWRKLSRRAKERLRRTQLQENKKSKTKVAKKTKDPFPHKD